MAGRHNRVWLTLQGWQHALENAPAAYRDEMAAWRDALWPVIARRADADVRCDDVCLGIALPPRPACGTKPRIALRVRRAHVSRVLPPIELETIAAAIPPGWQDAYRSLVRDAAASACSLKVFGSVALQAMTGMAYITPSSDIDVLFHPTDQTGLKQAVALLERHAPYLPLDGEFVFPTGEAVSWKEWSQAMRSDKQQRVLVKGAQAVRLATTADLLATLGHA